MKLGKSDTDRPTAPTGGAVIADRFKLDVDPNAGKGPDGVGRAGALAALIGSLAAIALLGATAALLYMNWDALQGV